MTENEEWLTDRRGRARVALKLQCRVVPQKSRKKVLWQETENVSRTGILLRWERNENSPAEPKIGDSVRVELKLPTHPTFGQRWMSFQAKVVRISWEDQRTMLVALETRQSRFRKDWQPPRQASVETAFEI